MAAVYPSIQKTIEDVAKHYPGGLRQAFGVGAMNTVEGYVHAELFSLIVPLAIAYLAVRSMASATSGAEEQGYLDTILSLPVSRRVLLCGAFVVTAVVLLVTLTVMGVMTFASGRLAGTHISAWRMAAGVLGTWPLGLFAAGLAAVGAGFLHNARSVVGTAVGMVVAMYALDLAGRLAHALEGLRWASVFRYYGAPLRDGIDPLNFSGLLIVSVALAMVGAVLFDRRDLLR